MRKSFLALGKTIGRATSHWTPGRHPSSSGPAGGAVVGEAASGSEPASGRSFAARALGHRPGFFSRSLLLVALVTAAMVPPASLHADPLFRPAPEHSFKPVLTGSMPLFDVVRSVPATSSSSGGGGTSLPVADTQTIVKGSADATKLIRFEVDGLTSGQTRVITAPDSNTTLPVFSQIVTFAGPTAARTVTLPDSDFTVAGIGTTNAFSGANSFIDGSFSILGSSDATKIAKFEVDGFTTGNTRTFTLPNASGTVGILGLAQSWTQTQTFNAVPGIITGAGSSIFLNSQAGIIWSTTPTPDNALLFTSATGNSWKIVEVGDIGFDANNGPCGTANCTNPHLIVHDTDQNVTDYSSLSVSGLAGRIVKTLVETTATAVVQISVAAEAGTSGEYLISVYATDGSTPQIRSLRGVFSVTNDGGTETCVLGTPEETDNTPTGTLTATVACDTAPTNAVNLTVDATSSLTQTTLEAYTQVFLAGPGQLLPQD